MAVRFTDDQINAINAKGTVLVSAAAGSGKTAVLTERVVTMLSDESNGISADRLLIVTFTNASALEMRVRISKRLDEICAENPENTHLLKQKLLLRSAKICTIDAYCIELVRSHFAMLGINPDFAVAETSQTEAIREQCLNEVLSKRYSEKSERFNSLSLLFGLDRNDKNLAEAIFKIHDYSMCMPRPDVWLKNAADGYSCQSIETCVFVPVILSHIIDTLYNSADTVSFLLREIAGTDIEGAYVNGLNDAFEDIQNMITLTKNKTWDELYDRLLNFKIEIGRVSKTNNPKLKDIVLAKRKGLVAKINGLAGKMTGPEKTVLSGLAAAKESVIELIDVVTEFSSAYFEALNRRNLLTFSHIEQLAFKLLCEEKDGSLVPSKISEEICRDFDEVLVDEYQDNNNLQDALFFALSSGGKHLFMVGDVKQSIYGFRNANPDNFLKHKDEYPLYDGVTSPCKVVLKENFRSRDGVCDFVNAFCNTVMKRSTCGMDYTDEEKLMPSAKYAVSDFPDVKLLLNEISDGKKREQTDAEEVASYIQSIIEQPPFLKADKDDVNKLRRAEYRDIAILLRSPGSRAKYYIDALKEKGIPVSYSTGDFYESPEILTAVSMLRTIDNPTHDIPLLSSMMSVMFGFTPDDLAWLRTNFKGETLYSSVLSGAANGDERCLLFVDTLNTLRTKAATVSVSRLLSEIYKATSLPEIMSAVPDCSSARDNLQRLVTLAAKYESNSDGSVAGFVSEFERMSNANKNAGSAIKSEGNAVKIMSFHGSKGLQFPICIVADCGGSFNKTDITNQMILNEKYGIGLKFVDDSENVKSTSVAREAMSILQQNKLISEEIRLIYVALTRAEEKLVLSLSLKNIEDEILNSVSSLGFYGAETGTAPASCVISADGYRSWIIMSALLQKSGAVLCKRAEVEPDMCRGDAVFDVKFSKVSVLEDDGAEVISNGVEYSLPNEISAENPSIAEEIKRRFDFKYPYEALSKVPSKLAVTELVHGDSNKYAFTLRPEFLSKSGLTPAERGTAAHKFMQFADYNRAETDVEAEIERLREWEYISFEEAEALESDKIARFFESDAYRRIKSANDVKREYKFMVEYPYNGDMTIVQGIADCIFEEDDGIVILDFKTDRVSDVNELSALYTSQLEVYKYALEKIMSKRVKECILYSLYLCQEVKC